MLLTRWATSGKSCTRARPQFLICQARARLSESKAPSPVTAPLPPVRVVLGKSPLRAPSGPPLPAPRPPASHPEPLLLVRLDLGVQLPQCVRETAEEQVLANQLVRALHGLRHRCASAVRVRGQVRDGGAGPRPHGEGPGEGASYVTPRPTYQHVRTLGRTPVAPPRPRPSPAQLSRSHHPTRRATGRRNSLSSFLAAGSGALSFELLKVGAAIQVN